MKVQMTIQFELDENLYTHRSDPDAWEWLWDTLLKNDLHLHSNEIGDTIGENLKVIDAHEI